MVKSMALAPQNQTQTPPNSVKPSIGLWSALPMREFDVKLTRLRIGHTRFTHRHLFLGQRAPRCPTCQVDFTVNHILIECPSFKCHREYHFNSQSLTLQDLVDNDLHNSDHFPLIISDNRRQNPSIHSASRYNFKLGNWCKFSSLANINKDIVSNNSIDAAVKNVTEVLIAAADRSIPKNSNTLKKNKGRFGGTQIAFTLLYAFCFTADPFHPSTASKGALHEKLSPLCLLPASHGQLKTPRVGGAWRPFRRVVHCWSPVYQFGWYPNRLVPASTKVSTEAGNDQSRWLPSLVGLRGGRCRRVPNFLPCRMGKKKPGPLSGRHTAPITNLNNHFDTFYIIKRTSSNKESFHNVSPFLVEKGISGQLGEVASVRKLRSGDLLIEVNSRKQAQQIIKLNNLSSIPVTVAAHATLNFSKGVVSCGELLHTPVEEITKELENQRVTSVRRITMRRDGKLLDTKHLIITFHSPKLPECIKAGYMRLAVRPYIPTPLRCFKCQRFGHSKDSCRGTLTCARCAEAGHESSGCTAEEKCVNCKGSHTSFSRSCSAWKFEKEEIVEKVTKNLSYIEARRIVKSRTPASGTSYANAVRKKPETTSTRILPTILPSVPFKASYIPSEICPRSIDPVLKLSSTDTHNETVSLPFKVRESHKSPPDFSDFKTVTNKEIGEASNSVIKQSNITVTKNGPKSAQFCSVGLVPDSMAAFPPEKAKVLQSLESDADAEMSSSSASEGDTLEYDMSEDLEDTPQNVCPTTPPPPSTARKR
ncbi:hypothetical protein AVEN_28130-1 [Araneus ventricosus]|uniref:CCHC-type domain-containing protein n=1 Tax=Araneus ventricosus TaxID=182803 RepID=A0A4Y2MMR3_ARAVE|nr:hypothetical protein AVEN_28130-1 [Araneus ventricosus]